MRTIGSALLAATLIVSSAFAATGNPAPLAPGKPAGVQKAQAGSTTILWVLGAGLVIGGIVLVATNNGGDDTPSGTTTTTTTTTSSSTP